MGGLSPDYHEPPEQPEFCLGLQKETGKPWKIAPEGRTSVQHTTGEYGLKILAESVDGAHVCILISAQYTVFMNEIPTKAFQSKYVYLTREQYDALRARIEETFVLAQEKRIERQRGRTAIFVFTIFCGLTGALLRLIPDAPPPTPAPPAQKTPMPSPLMPLPPHPPDAGSDLGKN